MTLKQLPYWDWVRLYRVELEEDYQKTDPDETLVRCEECYGKGYKECDLGHDHDCEECGGTGKVQGDSFEDFAQDQYQTQYQRDKMKVKRYELCLSQS